MLPFVSQERQQLGEALVLRLRPPDDFPPLDQVPDAAEQDFRDSAVGPSPDGEFRVKGARPGEFSTFRGSGIATFASRLPPPAPK
jgi:hypothetical protein